ncbi:MAG TPA: DNA-3-methyladenine glycosylase [Gemmatimonadaceae bacterium]|nr:DNA-3-methyladenine glycosylase [Gemmatimonadaceae bacterium]
MHRKAIAHLRRADPVLASIIDRVGPCRFQLRTEGTHFDAVVRSIIYQQLSGSAASTIHSRVLTLFGGSPHPAQLATVDDTALRSVGVSRQKIAYLKDLAARVLADEVPIERLHELEDAAVIDALTRVKGVGTWTAHMFLMFRLGRADVLPTGDLGIRKAMQRAYRMRRPPDERRMQRVAACWSPYTSVACWYLWRSLEQSAAAAPPKRQGNATPTTRSSRTRARNGRRPRRTR